jgi:hypothetical protein
MYVQNEFRFIARGHALGLKFAAAGNCDPSMIEMHEFRLGLVIHPCE